MYMTSFGPGFSYRFIWHVQTLEVTMVKCKSRQRIVLANIIEISAAISEQIAKLVTGAFLKSMQNLAASTVATHTLTSG